MPRRPAAPSIRLLQARLEELEQRLARLEAGHAPKGDGRAAGPAERKREVRRCPGCGLPLRRRKGRCVECGRPD